MRQENKLTETEIDQRIAALVKQLQNAEISVIEEANEYQTLMQVSDYTQAVLANELGKSQATIANKLRLLKLGEPAKDAIRKGEMTERHGRALLKLDKRNQAKVVHKIIHTGLTVKETEIIVKELQVQQLDVVAQRNLLQAFLKDGLAILKKQGVLVELEEDNKDTNYQVTLRLVKAEQTERKA
ncbi:hypothetical protein [Periweissella cryptocerci]|uniref:hypothetical protein n=1 Tax=Periweissella cryptocerci TaxID=2506420 RepID=UPI0014045441|nr:hypothetical protein [Periweissella cryptocerci]